jgi:hypothetical protein
MNADTCSSVSWLSFWRIIDLPFESCVAALESWQRTGQGGEPHISQSQLRWPIEHDLDSDTCWMEARLARGPLRPPLRMRLDIDRWSPPSARTALELIPCQGVRPTAAYFRSGHRLLDALTHSLLQHSPMQHLDLAPSGQPGPGHRPGALRVRQISRSGTRLTMPNGPRRST